MASGKSIPTLNRCGYQMATTSPLLDEWISSYDKVHPLLDLGCAFGINTFPALQRGIPTIALDTEQGHLDYITKTLTADNKPLATCVVGSLPNNIPVADNSISGILAAEVFQFLIGNDVEESLNLLHRKLTKGGKLVLTTMSDKFLPCMASKEREALFYNNLSKGEKWPGLLKVDEELLHRFSRFFKAKDMLDEFRKHMPQQLHLFSRNQMVDVLERTGYVVNVAKYSQHPGYPDGMRELEGLNLHIVAEKGLPVNDK